LYSQPQEHFITLPLVSLEKDNVCLPLVVNVVSKYWGEEIPEDEIMDSAKKYPQIKGSIMMEGIELAERHGLASYIYRGSLQDIKTRIDQGIPTIVILPGIYDTVQYASIVAGYNSEERRILTYVPEPDTIAAIPESKFEDDWEQDDRVTLIFVPKDMSDLFSNANLKFNLSNRICFQAEKLRMQGKINQALEQLRIAVKAEDDNPQVWCLLAAIHNDLNLKEATQYYERAIEINPRYYLGYRGLGNYYIKRKDYPSAEFYYTKAINVNPNRFGPIYKNRALARIELRDNFGAKEDLLHYLTQTPNATDRKTIEDAIQQL
jgi:tetratricopeptide (TPR) repeat protein